MIQLRTIFRGQSIGKPKSLRSLRSRSQRAILAFAVIYLAATVGFQSSVFRTHLEWIDTRTPPRLRELKTLASNAGSRSLVIALGSSRSEMGLAAPAVNRPSAAPEILVYNWSIPGGGPYRDLIELVRLLDSGVKPQAVLIEILPAQLGSQSRHHADDLLRDFPATIRTADFEALRPYLKKSASSSVNVLRARLSFWSYAANGMLLKSSPSFASEKTKQDRSPQLGMGQGWHPYVRPNMSREEHQSRWAQAEREYRSEMEQFELDPEIRHVFIDIAERCRMQKIGVACYLLPESPRFRKWTSLKSATQIRTFTESLTQDYGILIFDTSEWIDDESAFADGHHLLHHAALPFTEQFARTFLKPWIASLRE